MGWRRGRKVKPLGYLLGAGMMVEGLLMLASPRMVLSLYRGWRWVAPRPVPPSYDEVGSLPDRTLRAVALGELFIGYVMVTLARRLPD